MIVTICRKCSLSKAVALFDTTRKHGQHLSRMAKATDTANKFLIAGLGNLDIPRTRHSVGMQFVDNLAQLLDIRWSRNKNVQGFTAEKMLTIPGKDDGSIQEIGLVLLKSKQPMNLNGRSVGKTAQFHGIPPHCVYLVHDDLDKATGKFALKEGGSARGHNGVKSSISCLGTDSMPRLRIGIDRPADRAQVSDYVLSPMSKEEVAVFRGRLVAMVTALCRHVDKQAQLHPGSVEETILGHRKQEMKHG